MYRFYSFWRPFFSFGWVGNEGFNLPSLVRATILKFLVFSSDESPVHEFSDRVSLMMTVLITCSCHGDVLCSSATRLIPNAQNNHSGLAFPLSLYSDWKFHRICHCSSIKRTQKHRFDSSGWHFNSFNSLKEQKKKMLSFMSRLTYFSNERKIPPTHFLWLKKMGDLQTWVFWGVTLLYSTFYIGILLFLAGRKVKIQGCLLLPSQD